jgi:hypothetical protein
MVKLYAPGADKPATGMHDPNYIRIESGHSKRYIYMKLGEYAAH